MNRYLRIAALLGVLIAGLSAPAAAYTGNMCEQNSNSCALWITGYAEGFTAGVALKASMVSSSGTTILFQPARPKVR